jgi:hypothetical protein
MPIRKFFEIPAVGCLLVCRRFRGFEEAGFRDGVNCVVAEPDDLADVHFELSAHPERYEAMARQGQKLILEKHSVDARARDLSICLDAIVSNQFHGSQWVDGHHVLRMPVEKGEAS